MNAFPASAPCAEAPAAGEVLWIRAVNWLGDSVMTLPALGAFRRAFPRVRVLMGCRPGLAPFWEMCPAVDGVTLLPPGGRGDWAAARELRRLGAGRAVVFPQSFRSAWVPFLARVPERIGYAGHFRRFLLTRAAHPASCPGSAHQALDYYPLLGVEPESVPPVLDGLLRVPEAVRQATAERLGRAAAGLPGFPPGGPWMAVAPGAARGGSKRWPAEHFAAAVARIVRERPCGVIVCGTAAEKAAAAQIAAAAPGAAVDLTGATTLAQLAAVFRLCRLVLCNDSGAMHLGAAVGTPVVAIFGLTDPGRTGPLGRGHAVLAPPGVAGHAAIARESGRAAEALAAIRPESVAAAAVGILNGNGGAPHAR
jgi:lipopolysaccharide heptosyltransferase II